ncbi:MAG: hypothetical protein WBO49_02370 [Candidatus Saccharimonas sp.]
MNILKSATGHYETAGNSADADVIIGHSFGTSTHRESPNGALAQFILDHEDGQPIVVDRTLADAFPKSTQLDLIIEGAVSNTTGSVGGSWGILIGAKEFMDQTESVQPLMVAQAFHIGRVAMQAEKIGMHNVIIPEQLPDIFDKESEQFWTRSSSLWIPREVVGSFKLRGQGKL